jgi:haloacid dehalogenase-like hydrolase
VAQYTRGQAQTPSDPLASWNDGPAKQAILDFVRATTDQSSKDFVKPEDRIATFDQDGTLWVEHPGYGQAMFALDRVHTLAPQHPEWQNQEPFKSVLSNDPAAIGKFTESDWLQIVGATLAGMTEDDYTDIVQHWIEAAKHPRFNRHYTDLVYQPMLEAMKYLRASGFRTYIVTGWTGLRARVCTARIWRPAGTGHWLKPRRAIRAKGGQARPFAPAEAVL